jgi:hypothetical protein
MSFESAAMTHFYNWAWQAPLGLILVGTGLSLFGQAVIYKSRGEPLKRWFLWGTASLIVINAGLCVFGDAVRHRVIYEMTQPVLKQ